MICPYTNIISLQSTIENDFSYVILVPFPIDIQQLNKSVQLLLNQSFEYVFEVTSLEDCQQAEQIIEQYQIEKYQLKPVYTGDNIVFFEENVFLTKENILSASLSIKDFFANQSMNIYDFGKINIMPNGDAYANVNHPTLGNIYTHSIHEIVYKEIDEGESWSNIRNQIPCNNCVYQWLCPPPSDYEIVIDRPNLCHVK
jgi:pseudo-rSAM protein